MKDSVVRNKSFSFAIRIVKLYRFLYSNKNEFIISKQLLRSGTSVGALVREAQHAESTPDFKHKFSIAQKEMNETLYWLELLKETDYISLSQFESLHSDALEIMKLITSILKTMKYRQTNN
jgi:four helix bundle protein